MYTSIVIPTCSQCESLNQCQYCGHCTKCCYIELDAFEKRCEKAEKLNVDDYFIIANLEAELSAARAEMECERREYDHLKAENERLRDENAQLKKERDMFENHEQWTHEQMEKIVGCADSFIVLTKALKIENAQLKNRVEELEDRLATEYGFWRCYLRGQ